ncbi:MAG: ATP-binding domain-containing protein [Deltaproteobacteria bacterium]|nr:ATP-binding domain-containing protein [Deltaproteobacteria bacterium]
MSEQKTKDVIIDEEESELKKVRKHLLSISGKSSSFMGYDTELIELRDAIAEALPEDVPSLVEQMTRLQALAAQRGQGEDVPLDPDSPYFGHMVLDEETGKRDVLLGKRTYLSAKDGVSIVDWRNAPISRMYYIYEEGDDYDEVFGGKPRSGIVESRRSVTITDGQMRRIDAPQGTFVKRGDEWITQKDVSSTLKGGQGTSVRAASKGHLGIDSAGIFRTDKHLPEISGLLDKEQFAMISNDTNELLAIQGSAGSGKTTVGLHRIAYLAYRGGKNFHPANMIVIVLNDALASYIKEVLPSLGVRGVKVWTFAKWTSRLRRRLIKGLPSAYSEWTPSVVSRVKKHPAVLRILSDMTDMQDEKWTDKLLEAIEPFKDAKRVKTAWNFLKRVPLDVRRRRIAGWLDGETRIGKDNGEELDNKTAIAVDSILGAMALESGNIISDWADLFTDKNRLIEMFNIHAPCEFTEGELTTVYEWCASQYKIIAGYMDTDEDDNNDGEEAVIDVEDDAVLLRLYQLKMGWLKEGSRKIEYDHMMIDEVQDFSALEVRVLLDTVGRNRPVTMAGDTAQKIVREGGFDDWETFLDEAGIRGARVEPLKIAYRSTIEVMEIATKVLGPLAGDKAIATRHGAPVELHQFSDPGQAVDFLSGSLRDLFSREPHSNVAVVARHLSQAKIYYQGLKKAEIPYLRFVGMQDFSFKPGIEVTEIRQVKGLEFDYVIMVDCNNETYPVNNESRHLMHVGMTRAAHQLWLVTTGKPSPLLPEELL